MMGSYKIVYDLRQITFSIVLILVEDRQKIFKDTNKIESRANTNLSTWTLKDPKSSTLQVSLNKSAIPGDFGKTPLRLGEAERSYNFVSIFLFLFSYFILLTYNLYEVLLLVLMHQEVVKYHVFIFCIRY